MLEYARRLAALDDEGVGAGLYMWGEAGIGKSHISVGLAKEFMDRGMDPIFMTADTYSFDTHLRLEPGQVWIIDDMNSGYGISSRLYKKVILNIHDRGGRVFVTSNKPYEELMREMFVGDGDGRADALRRPYQGHVQDPARCWRLLPAGAGVVPQGPEFGRRLGKWPPEFAVPLWILRSERLFVTKLPVLGLIIVPFVGTLYAVYLAITGDVSLTDILLCVIGVVLTEYGITMGYHRLVVHKAYEAVKPLKAFILALGSMAFQGPVVHWASVHTKHHAHSDHEGDPHSPTVSGFIYAHFEWLIEMNSDELGEIVDKWGKRYTKDPMISWFSDTFLFWALFSLILPAAIGFLAGGWWGAWTGFIWGGLVRIFISSHVTWSVNSVLPLHGQPDVQDHG